LSKFVLRFLHENLPLKTNENGDKLKTFDLFTPNKSFVTYLKVLQRVFGRGCNKIKRPGGNLWGRYETSELGVRVK